MGLLPAPLYVLSAVCLLALLEWVTWRRGSRLFILFAFVASTVAHLINAKRGGIYSALFYLLVGLSIYYGDPVRALAAMVPGRSRILTKASLIVLAITLVFAFGYLASIRTRG